MKLRVEFSLKRDLEPRTTLGKLGAPRAIAMGAVLVVAGCASSSATVARPPTSEPSPVLAAASAPPEVKRAPTTAAPAVEPPGIAVASIKIANPLASARSSETIAIKLADLVKVAPSLTPATVLVADASGTLVESQLVDMDGDETPDELVFQTNLAASETKTFEVLAGKRAPATLEQFKVHGRFVRERHDDFAWENDRMAHRVYGTGLETYAKDPLTSSGFDVWCKRTRKLVVDDWYVADNYHVDTGEGADFYGVGKSRGCGGIGIWAGDKLHVSKNFTGSRVLANGPIRLVFELSYAPWSANGGKIAETKRVIVDAGKNFDRFESTFKIEGAKHPLMVGIGISKHPGGTAQFDPKTGSLREWEPLHEPNGNLGCAIVLSPGASAEYQQNDTDYLLVTRGPTNQPLTYYAGFGWDRSGDFADAAAWAKYVEDFSHELAAPPSVSLSAKAAAKP